MKSIVLAFLLLSSTGLHAQNKKQSTNNPTIKVTPAISTTVTNQPASMPGSNTSPTTGTVIRLKTNKNTSKASKPDAQPVNATADSSSKKTSTHKRVNKAKRVQ
jgi:hypothetical protein